MKRIYAMLLTLILTISLAAPRDVKAAQLIDLSNEDSATTLYVGQTYRITVPREDVLYSSSNLSVARLNKYTGTTKAIAEGIVTITVRDKATREVIVRRTFTVKEYRENYVTKAKQTKLNTITLTFKEDVTKLDINDFKVQSMKTEELYKLNDYSIHKEDPKLVDITVFGDIVDKGEISITYKDRTVTFESTDGATSYITIFPTEIPAYRNVDIYYNLYDKNGIILHTYPIDKKLFCYESTLYVMNGHMENHTISLTTLNSAAYARVVYHSYQYVDGKETGYFDTGEVEIRVTNQIDIDSSIYHIGHVDSLSTVIDPDFTANHTLFVNQKDQEVFLYLNYLKDYEINYYGSYLVESSDTSIFEVKGRLDEKRVITVTGKKEGKADIIVKDSNGIIIAKLPIEVVKEK